MRQLQITEIANGFIAGTPPEPNPLDPNSPTQGKVVHLADIDKLAEYVKHIFQPPTNIAALDTRKSSKRN